MFQFTISKPIFCHGLLFKKIKRKFNWKGSIVLVIFKEIVNF